MNEELNRAVASVGLPFCFVEGDPVQFREELAQVAEEQRPVLFLSGARMRSWGDLYDELQVAFKLPSYFGRNLDALDECLTDLSWIPGEKGFVVAIDDEADVLAREGPGEVQRFAGVLTFATSVWGTPRDQREPWDRDWECRPFLSCIRVDALAVDAAEARWNPTNAHNQKVSLRR